jgi:hypothetical protein
MNISAERDTQYEGAIGGETSVDHGLSPKDRFGLTQRMSISVPQFKLAFQDSCIAVMQ